MVVSIDIKFMESTFPDFIVWRELVPKQSSSVWAYLFLTNSVAVLSSLSSSDFQTDIKELSVVALEVILLIIAVTCSICHVFY